MYRNRTFDCRLLSCRSTGLYNTNPSSNYFSFSFKLFASGASLLFWLNYDGGDPTVALFLMSAVLPVRLICKNDGPPSYFP